MSEAKVASKTPYGVEVEAGKNYSWCACGLSAKQPFCDGSHASTNIRPKLFHATENKKVFFCGCKQTKTPTLCDGSHKNIP